MQRQLEFIRFEINGRHQLIDSQPNINIGNDADTLEKTLYQFTVPASTIETDEIFRLSAVGVGAMNNNVKSLGEYIPCSLNSPSTTIT